MTRKYLLSSNGIHIYHVEQCSTVKFPRVSYYDSPTYTYHDRLLTVCMDEDPGIPWIQPEGSIKQGFYYSALDMILGELNQRYGWELKPEWITINHTTNSVSYLQELVYMLNNQTCDVVISMSGDVANTMAELKDTLNVDFSCPLSASRNAIVRSALQPEKIIDSLASMNDPSVSVYLPANLSYQQLWLKDFPLANVTFKPTDYDFYSGLLNNEFHVTIKDEVSANNWRVIKCVQCYVYSFGEAIQHGLMFRKSSMPNTGHRDSPNNKSLCLILSVTSLVIWSFLNLTLKL